MANDLTGQNIKDTYKRVLTVGDDGLMYDGTGSLYTPLSASHEITTELSSSHAVNANTASFATNFTASGNISSSGNLIISKSLTFGAAAAEIISPTQLKIKGADIGGVGNDYLLLSNDNIDTFINGSEVFSIDASQIILNASGQNIDTKINYDSGLYSYFADASTERTKMYGFITIAVSGSSTVPAADSIAGTNTALLVSGSQYNIGAITSSGAISSSGIITALSSNIVTIDGGSF